MNNEIHVVEHDNQRLLTTGQLALAYGTESQILTNNFNRNKSRYKEHKHYIALMGQEKRDFLNLNQFDVGSKNAATLYLWTEKGAWLHAKSLNTDKAWDAYELLVDEYYRIKEQVQQTNLLPTTYKEALLALVEQVEQNERLHIEKLMLEQVVAENKPKITYYDTILRTINTITIRQIAADYGLTAQMLNKILFQKKIQYKQSGQWLLYKEHLGKGYTQSESHVYKDSKENEMTKLSTKWTQKGRLYIHGILEEMGIKPLMDQENSEAV